MRKRDHWAIDKAIKQYENHTKRLLKITSNSTMTERQVAEFVFTEVETAMLMIANSLLEFGENEDGI